MVLRYNSYLLYLLMLVLQWVVGFKAWSNALASKDKTTFSTKPQLSPLGILSDQTLSKPSDAMHTHGYRTVSFVHCHEVGLKLGVGAPL